MTPTTVRLDRPVLEAARSLLGCELVRETEDGTSRARIIETEAYSENDPASHSYNGETPRTKVMFGPPGHWYIYKCYGIHWMINVVTGENGTGEAVLVRSAEPLGGEQLMQQRRGQSGYQLTSGPGKLAEALAVNDSFNGQAVHDNATFRLEPGTVDRVVHESPRVGIQDAQERFWRFFVESDYLSRVDQNASARRRD
ncbi:MAG: DNA-3-methyladenine glycosylase [bacterium]